MEMKLKRNDAFDLHAGTNSILDTCTIEGVDDEVGVYEWDWEVAREPWNESLIDWGFV